MNDSKRISTRVAMTAVTAIAAAAALFAVFAATGEPPPPGPASEAAPERGKSAAPGWRWESYGGVEAQVPETWGYGGSDWPPCMDRSDDQKHGYVGRPGGAIPAIGCTGPSVPPLDKRIPYLWFRASAEPGVRTHDAGWVEETRTVRGLALTVFSDDAALRTRILDSAGPASDGCPAEHAVATNPDARPDPGPGGPDAGPGGVAEMGPVESITVCRYALGEDNRPAASRVLSSSHLSGADAQAVVRAILAAPEGGGPNEPGNCAPEASLGDEALLLLVRDGTHTQEVVVRYSGCDGHGIDDGHTHRSLTAEALIPLLTGPHQPDHLIGPVASLVWH